MKFYLGPKDRLKFCVNFVLEWSGLTPGYVNTWKDRLQNFTWVPRIG